MTSVLRLILYPIIILLCCNGSLGANPADPIRQSTEDEILKMIDSLIESDQPKLAAQFYSYFDCLLVDEIVIEHSNKVLEALRKSGIEIIATTDPSREPQGDEIVIVYGNYQHAHNNLPYINKIWRHPLYYPFVIHSSVEYHPAWDSIGAIYILNLEERRDRYQEILAELCRMQAPLDRILPYVVHKEIFIEDQFLNSSANCTKNHGDLVEHFLKTPHEHCLILEDDVTFSADVEGNLQRLSLFFSRNYDYEVCLLNASKFHLIKEYDDLLLRSYQECTTASAYLLSRVGAEQVLFFFRDGFKKLLSEEDSYFTCDRYWSEMQKNDKFFLFKTKFGYQRVSYSSITEKTQCYFD